MKVSLLLFCTMLGLNVSCQSSIDVPTSEGVTTPMWQEFKRTYEAKDWKGFNAIHTEDVLRITPRGIRVGDEYRDSNRTSFERKGEPERVIDFAFEHQVQNDSISYEVGFYQLKYFEDGKVTAWHYGRFHVRAVLDNGQWKIAQDWDSDGINGDSFGVQDFEGARLLELN